MKEGQLPPIIVAVEKGDYAGVLVALEGGDSIHTVDGPVRKRWRMVSPSCDPFRLNASGRRHAAE